jgi:tRNA A-37 threonylcarbamoyl transferase component Bud32
MSPPTTGTTSESRAIGDAKASPWRRVVHGGYIWLVQPGATQDDIAMFLAGVHEPRDFIRHDERSSSAVFRFSNFVAKRYNARTARDRIKTLLRGPRARRALFWATRVEGLGVATIRPAAVASSRWRPWDSYLVTHYIAGHCSIHEFVQRRQSSLERRWLINTLVDIMVRLHNAGISHGDAHLANFIVERGVPPRLILADLDALRRRTMSATIAANDLKRLLDYAPGSPFEHLRFLVRYASHRQPAIRARELLWHLQAQRRGPGPLRHAP